MFSSDSEKIFSLVIAFVSDSAAINQKNVFVTNWDYIKNCEGMKVCLGGEIIWNCLFFFHAKI